VIDEYVAENNLEYREDETNSDESFLRNRIRHSLIPNLAENYDSRIEETLSERARDLQDDIECLKRMIEEPLAALSKYPLLSRSWLRELKKIMPELDEQLRWRLAEAALLPVLGYTIGRSHAKDAVKLLTGEIVALELPGGVTLRAKNGGLEKVAVTVHTSSVE
jgi:tRNA(Ile)-lysidine synthase